MTEEKKTYQVPLIRVVMLRSSIICASPMTIDNNESYEEKSTSDWY